MKTQHKILSLLISFCVIFGMSPTLVFAQNTTLEGVWTEHVANAFAGGQGTEADPYQIATAEQLAKLANDVNTGTNYSGSYFKLTDNIDLSNYIWPGIGYFKPGEERAFSGFLDGNDQTITHLRMEKDEGQVGLFGYIRTSNDNDVVVKNLTISDANITVNSTEEMTDDFEVNVGILVGSVENDNGHKTKFENISVSGKIQVNYVPADESDCAVGGMIGYGDQIIATNCTVENVSITGSSNNAGGFVGMTGDSTYSNCVASGSLQGSWSLGGFVGYSYSLADDDTEQAQFENCMSNVKIEGNNSKLGGFVGLSEYSKFTNCMVLGDVVSSFTGVKPKVGGFIGESGSEEVEGAIPSIKDCHVAGTVTSASSDYQAGGFIGEYTGGSYSDCSFDQQKNPDLSAIGNSSASEEDTPSNIEGEDSETVLGNLCEDFYGGHQYSTEWTIDVEPTCTEEGSKSHHCERCNAKTDITSVPAKGHTYTWIIDKEPTKDQAGLKYQYCVECHHKTNTVSIPAIGYTEQVESAVYRAYNPNNGEHLYTTNYDEFIYITNRGWKDEGVSFMTELEKEGHPVYRVYNPNSGLHHYTTDENEKTVLVSLGWKDEGVAWYASKKPQSAPVYRVYNPNGGQHHYTKDIHEKDVLVSLGWHDEGIAFRTA